jgi:histidine triad (HIT) family protein
LYRDNLFVVISDAFPRARGHSLIIPLRHAKDIYDLTPEEAAAMYPLAQKMAAKLAATLEADGIKIEQNNGAAAGQVVFHFHLHLIPHYNAETQIGDPKQTAALLNQQPHP